MSSARFSPIVWILSFVLASAACKSSSDSAGAGGASSLSSTLEVHYRRPLHDYEGWTLHVSGSTKVSTVTASDGDRFGVRFAVPLEDAPTEVTLTLEKAGVTEPMGTVDAEVLSKSRSVWFFAGSPRPWLRAPPVLPSENQVAVYYVRPDGEYAGWGLHTWGDVANPTPWSSPEVPEGIDSQLGAAFLVDVKPGGQRVNFIVHKGDEKDPGADMGFDRAALGDLVWMVSGSSELFSVPKTASPAALRGAAAHLLSRGRVAWKVASSAARTFELRFSLTADLAFGEDDVTGGEVISLAPLEALEPELAARWPHLSSSDFRAFAVPLKAQSRLAQALKGQLVAVARNAEGRVVQSTLVQTPGALDDLFATDAPMGLTFSERAPTFRLWAPTAQSVTLQLFDAEKRPVAAVPMAADAQGVWSFQGPRSWYGLFYRFELVVFHPQSGRIETVQAVDPWGTNFSTNSRFAQVLDLADPATKPLGWDFVRKPALTAPEDIVVYELHVRDFSALDETVPASRRGTFLAFVEDGALSHGQRHLRDLASAGVTHLHLLPAFDFATVEENRSARLELDATVAQLCARNPAVPAQLCAQEGPRTLRELMESADGGSTRQQELAGYLRELDGFNWGYDPLNFGAPEGSYASTPEGPARIRELRQLVKAMADAGLRVVLDVVYNHMNAAGLGDKSVLDKVVPGYYHRRHPVTGAVESSSCCANTASEHRMMERLMSDTLVRWARDYKIDGFRFDLMGHHMKSNLLHVRDRLAALTLAKDGVDGSKLYLYGEGWNFGEVADNARGVNATQLNMAGTGIGTFNDRLRDAVRGGSAFDSGASLRRNQGFATGLYTAPNEASVADAAEKAKLLATVDLVKIGLAGTLSGFRFVDGSGATVAAKDVSYHGVPAGYTSDPQETINYVSKHDNQTLFDIAQYKLPTGTSMADRVRAHNLALDAVLFAQGVPFFQAGDDLLRSKSMERDSYDSGDWFNRLDFSGLTSQWRQGLPRREVDGVNWSTIEPLFGDTSVSPRLSYASAAHAHFVEALAVRRSSRLFRLATGDEVKRRVDFVPVETPGLVVMTLTDGTCAGADLDPRRDGLVVVFNASPTRQSVELPGVTGLALHATQVASADDLVRASSVEGSVGGSVAGSKVSVAGRTAAVFELLQSGAQGAGLPCNTR